MHIPRTIHEAAKAVRSGTLSSEQLVASCFAAIKNHDAQIHAFFALREREAREEAGACDAETAAGRSRGPLHGIPLAIKDNIDVQGMPTSAASPLFAHAAPAHADAPVVAKLRKAGAVILGKNNMDELAAHISGRTSCAGPVYNPWQLEKKLSPGGSSSGTAAAVAAGFCLGGLGTDTGGSIRIPAGWCGLCGIRPTYGQTAMAGVYPRARSLDAVGPIGLSPQDVRLLLHIIAEEPLAKALTASSAPVFSSLRIGIFPDLCHAASPDVSTVYSHVLSRCEQLGAHCVPVELDTLDDPGVAETVNTIRAFEFARDIAVDMENNAGAAHVHPVPQADYLRGKTISRENYEDALRRMALLNEQVSGVFQQTGVQAFLLPTALFTAPSSNAGREVFAAGRRLVNLFSLARGPSVVFRGGLAQNGLPVGMQLVGPFLSEGLLLDIADACEQAYGEFLSPCLR